MGHGRGRAPSSHATPRAHLGDAPEAPTLATLTALNRFAHPAVARSAWQVASTLALLVLTIAGVRRLAPSASAWLLLLPLGAILTRLFVLQHDCGHHSLFRGRRTNDAVGTALSWITGVAYEPWRTEHAWHHAHQGQLEARGIDHVNSPMTAEEARRDPDAASRRSRLIRVYTVFLLGFVSLLVKRKRLGGFFHYRPGFRWRVGDRAAQARGFVVSLAGHGLVHVAYVVTLGGAGWASIVLPAYFVGAGCGALLFWVQHNFERTYHANQDRWSYVATGAQGSSYLAMPAVLRYFSADIGLHHVHHLHPRIPNYRLEEARRALPELAAIAPLDGRDLERCFSHVFWDQAKGRMVTHEEL